MRDAWAILLAHLRELEAAAIRLTKRYCDNTMVGRTHNQHGLPMMLGMKIASRGAGIRRSIGRMTALSERAFLLMLHDGVDIIAGFGPQAQATAEAVAKDLDLNLPRSHGPAGVAVSLNSRWCSALSPVRWADRQRDLPALAYRDRPDARAGPDFGRRFDHHAAQAQCRAIGIFRFRLERWTAARWGRSSDPRPLSAFAIWHPSSGLYRTPCPTGERILRLLYCSSDSVRRRSAASTNLSHNASFHSRERTAPPNRGIKHLNARGQLVFSRSSARAAGCLVCIRICA